MEKGFIKNCYIQPSVESIKDGGSMFVARDDGDGTGIGTCVATLDGYAIIPLELYEAFIALPEADAVHCKYFERMKAAGYGADWDDRAVPL
jgi:hypothetical protein